MKKLKKPTAKVETPIETTATNQEPPVEEKIEEVVVPVEESDAKRSFRAFIEKYRVQNPAKYALKEKELLAQLDKIP